MNSNKRAFGDDSLTSKVRLSALRARYEDQINETVPPLIESMFQRKVSQSNTASNSEKNIVKLIK